MQLIEDLMGGILGQAKSLRILKMYIPMWAYIECESLVKKQLTFWGEGSVCGPRNQFSKRCLGLL